MYCRNQNYNGSGKMFSGINNSPEIIIVQSFSGFVRLAGQITGISLTGNNSSKKVSKITGCALSRINSVIFSARTVVHRVGMSENAMGGWKKRGRWKTSLNDTPPTKGGFGPLVRYVFHPPLGVSALFFRYKNPRQSRPQALLEGSKHFWENAFSGTFSSPHTLCTPSPYP